MTSQEIGLSVEGMTCASCSAAVERALRSNPTVAEVNVNLLDGTARVVIDNFSANEVVDVLVDAVYRAGYIATALDQTDSARGSKDDTVELRSIRRRAIVALALTTPWAVAMVAMPFGVSLALPLWVQAALSGVVVLGVGSPYFATAYRAARHGRTHMDTLVSLGAGVSYGYSLIAWLGYLGSDQPVFFESAAFLIAFISLGKWLEAVARGRAKSALVGLLELVPDRARVIEEGKEREVLAGELKPGDRVVVLPSERIPADGVVRRGESAVDEAMLTGESIPVRKGRWDDVFGGTVNTTGRLEIEVTRSGHSTAVAGIVRRVQEAQSRAAPIQRVADRISAFFVPIVIVVAVSTFVAWWFLDAPLADRLSRACAVIVIACPCALGLATPTAILVGSAIGLRNGILIKNGAALEQLARAATVFLDKTGTVTTGEFAVDRVTAVSKGGESALLQLAASLESHSRHPLASAVVSAAHAQQLELLDVDGFKEQGGLGLEGVVEGSAVRVGRRNYVDSEGEIDESDSDGSVVYVSRDGRVLGSINLSDRIRTEARTVVAELRSMGVSTVLLTGDRSGVASRVATAVGIDNVRAEVLPGEKQEIVKGERQRGTIVAMVGDGINDGPALAEADVGVAIGTGTDIAKETGDIVLMYGSLTDLVVAVRLARATLDRVKLNLGWAFIYNVLGIPIAAGVFASAGLTLRPEFAGLAMALSSVSVVTSSLLLRGRAKRFLGRRHGQAVRLKDSNASVDGSTPQPG